MAYTITAPLPGSVWKIQVAVGDKVEEDQTVVILESMKMENEIFSEEDGTVAKILVEEGQAVKSGDPLVELE